MGVVVQYMVLLLTFYLWPAQWPWAYNSLPGIWNFTLDIFDDHISPVVLVVHGHLFCNFWPKQYDIEPVNLGYFSETKQWTIKIYALEMLYLVLAIFLQCQVGFTYNTYSTSHLPCCIYCGQWRADCLCCCPLVSTIKYSSNHLAARNFPIQKCKLSILPSTRSVCGLHVITCVILSIPVAISLYQRDNICLRHHCRVDNHEFTI